MLPRGCSGRIYIVDTLSQPRPRNPMVTTIQRWGNSLAIRIPKPFAVQAQLSEDADVEITLDGDRLVITPAKREWNLDKLLRQVSPSNLHREVRWGDTKGKEVW